MWFMESFEGQRLIQTLSPHLSVGAFNVHDLEAKGEVEEFTHVRKPTWEENY